MGSPSKREAGVAANDYRPEGRFAVHGASGGIHWVIVHQLWFEIDAVPEGRDRWQASGIRRYRLADGRELVALDASRFVVDATGEQLQRSDVHAASSHSPLPLPSVSWPPSPQRTATS